MRKVNYFILVSEPWNFESFDGKNIIKGKIEIILSNRCLVFKTDYFLNFGEIKGNILILSPRHKENDFSNFHNEVDVNGGILLKKFERDSTEQYLKEHSKFVLIGSLKKE